MKKLCLLLPLLLLLALAGPMLAQEEQRKIRVGFPLQQGMAELDADGRYSGYTYEYLQEIAQYTGWEYEFMALPEIGDPMPALMDMLEQGHLDLLGPLPASADNQARFSFPGYSYGMSSSALYVSDDNTALNEANYRDVDGRRIAIYDQPFSRLSDLENFCASNSIEAAPVPCGSAAEQVEAVRGGRADALLGSDMTHYEGVRLIAKFAPTPFYFATGKGNTSVVSGLNLAIQRITASDPDFSTRLYKKYFSEQGGRLFFTDSEKTYLQRQSPIRVLVVPDHAPFQDYSENGAFRGVTRNVLDSISQQTGLQFLYTRSEGSLNDGLRDADLVAAIPYDYAMAAQYGLALTRPFAESQIVMIANRLADISMLEDRRLVLPRGFTMEDHDSADVVRLHSVLDCIEAVNRGDADFSFANGYTAAYYNNQSIYKNITLTPQTGMSQKICFGVAKPVDADLLTILNKCILSMTRQGAIQTMLYTNTAPEPNLFSVSFLVSNYPVECLLALLVLAAFVIGAAIWVLRIRTLADKKLALAGKRYMLLSEVANEYLFEYDYLSDKLTLAPKLAALFRCGQTVERWRHFVEGSGDVLAYDPAGLLTRKTKKEKLERDLLLPLPEDARCWFRVFCLTLYDHADMPAYLVGKLTNIQREMEEKGLLLEKSQKDGLTGVYNAATSRELISSYLDNRPAREDAALLIIDIDSFKTVNDVLGHFVGDEVLKYVAGRLRAQVRKSDVIGRLGGDEFIVLVKDVTDRDAVLRKGDELCAAIRKTVSGRGRELLITVSAGGVMADGCGFDELYRKADQALYAVKSLGKDRFYLCGNPNDKPKQPHPEEGE